MRYFIRTRVIVIDVIPNDSDPFISMALEKVTVDDNGVEVQVIGNYDRIVKRLSNVSPVPIENIANDGMVSAHELMMLIATHTGIWVIQKYGGTPKEGGGVWVDQ